MCEKKKRGEHLLSLPCKLPIRISGSGFGFRVPPKLPDAHRGDLVKSFGFRVSSCGFRVSDFGVRDSGFGIRDSGFGLRVKGLGSRV